MFDILKRCLDWMKRTFGFMPVACLHSDSTEVGRTVMNGYTEEINYECNLCGQQYAEEMP